MSFKTSWKGKETINPNLDQIKPKKPIPNPPIVNKGIKGRIKILTIGDKTEIRPKLKIKTGKTKTWAPKVELRLVLNSKILGIFLNILEKTGVK